MQEFHLHEISKNEFENAEHIYKVIAHDRSNTYAYFLLNERKYFLSYFSNVPVVFMKLESSGILLVGIDQKMVAIGLTNGRILLSLGLFSLFKYFADNSEIDFKVACELEDIFINKNGFSIGEIISHDPEF